MGTIGNIVRHDIDHKICAETDSLDAITSIWPNQICHEQVLSLVKVVVPFLERMNLREPIHKAMRGVKIPTVPHIGWSRYAHEIQKSRGIGLAETKTKVMTSKRKKWEQKWLDKGLRFMKPKRWDNLYARNSHLQSTHKMGRVSTIDRPPRAELAICRVPAKRQFHAISLLLLQDRGERRNPPIHEVPLR